MSITYTIGSSKQMKIQIQSEAANCMGTVKTSAPTSTVPNITLIEDEGGIMLEILDPRLKN